MIELRSIDVHSGSFTLSDIDLNIAEASYAVLMGGTGQGKTTLLEAICGLRRVSSGQILLDGVDVTQWLPGDRGVGYVPQDVALFPHSTVREHLSFPLRLRRAPRRQIQAKTLEIASLLRISDLLERRPLGLSGGEAQRVALGRAISFNPSILLLDEPLSALDESTRQQTQSLLLEITRKHRITTLHVTHRRDEAEMLADCRFVLQDGRVDRCGDEG